MRVEHVLENKRADLSTISHHFPYCRELVSPTLALIFWKLTIVYISLGLVVRSNRIGTSPVEIVAPSLGVIERRRVYVARSDGSGRVAAAVGREEVCELVVSSPGRDPEGSKALWPGCTGVVPDVDSLLDIAAAVTITEGIDDEGGSTGSEGGHDGSGGGDGETHCG